MGDEEAGFPPSREPDVGLDPRTLGSRPELKADASLTEPPRCPSKVHFSFCFPCLWSHVMKEDAVGNVKEVAAYVLL